MAIIDLDAARAARAEARKDDPNVLTIGGKTYTLLLECPMEVGRLWARGQLYEGLKILMGDEQYDAFMAEPSLTSGDLIAVSGLIAGMYGFETAGNSSASPASSKRTGKRSRPTSPVSTE